MKQRLIIALCLPAIFASGGLAGWVLGSRHTPATDAFTVNPAVSTGDWMESATQALARDLSLTSEETDIVRKHLAPVAQNIIGARDRAQLAIHLRLLEAHDILAMELPGRGARLKVSREKLRQLILTRFAPLIKENPSPLLGANQL